MHAPTMPSGLPCAVEEHAPSECRRPSAERLREAESRHQRKIADALLYSLYQHPLTGAVKAGRLSGSEGTIEEPMFDIDAAESTEIGFCSEVARPTRRLFTFSVDLHAALTPPSPLPPPPSHLPHSTQSDCIAASKIVLVVIGYSENQGVIIFGTIV